MSTMSPAHAGSGDSLRGARRSDRAAQRVGRRPLGASSSSCSLFTKVVQPDYGAGGITALALAALPFAYATAGQTVAIISGGLDLSIAAMMALVSVCAATLMEGQSEEFGLLAVPLILLLGLGPGRDQRPDHRAHPDPGHRGDAGLLLHLGGRRAARPGRARRRRLAGGCKDLILGTRWVPAIPVELSQWVPKALDPARRDARRRVAAAQSFAPGSLDLRHRLGSPGRLPERRARWTAPRSPATRSTGLFAAMGGLILVMITGNGNPVQGPYLLASVAAVVLGGRQPGRREGQPRRAHRGHLHPAPRPPGPGLPLRRPQRRPGRRGPHHGRPRAPRRRHRPCGADGREQRRRDRWARRPDAGDECRIVASCATTRSSRSSSCSLALTIVARAHPARHRQRALGRQHGQVRHPAGDPRGGADTDDADGRHRPLGRIRGHGGGLRHGLARHADGPHRGDPALAPARHSWPGWPPGSASASSASIRSIMTLAVGLVVQGLLFVYQRALLGSNLEIPGGHRLARDRPFVRHPQRAARLRAARGGRSSTACGVRATGGSSTHWATTRGLLAYLAFAAGR